MRMVAVRRWSMMVLGAGVLLQFGGCIDSLIPGAIAVAEQVVLSIVFSRLLPA